MIRDRLPVTAPARTLLDLAAILPYLPLRRAVREAMALRRVAIRQLVDVLARRGPCRGSRAFARIISEGYTPTESVLSDIVLDLILAGGFERPEVSKPLILGGRKIVPDFRWPEQRIVVEADGAQWHDHPLARQDDAERDALLEAHGHHVIHITWDQAVTKQQQTLGRIEVAGAPLTIRTSRNDR
jgi:very-short-patch-repair endonuclease